VRPAGHKKKSLPTPVVDDEFDNILLLLLLFIVFTDSYKEIRNVVPFIMSPKVILVLLCSLFFFCKERNQEKETKKKTRGKLLLKDTQKSGLFVAFSILLAHLLLSKKKTK